MGGRALALLLLLLLVAACTPAGDPEPDLILTEMPPATAEPSPTLDPDPERVQIFANGNQTVNMRREPGSNAPVVRALRDGTEVTIVGLDREGDGRIWRNVQDGDATGWVAATALRGIITPTATLSQTPTPAETPTPARTPTPTTSPTPPGPTATPEPERVEVFGVGAGGANLRAEPSTSARVVQTIPEGARLTIVGEDREVAGRVWRNVRGESGTEGWLAGEVVRTVSPPTAAPTLATEASATGTPATGTPATGTGTPAAATGMATLVPSAPAPASEPERVEVFGTGNQGANLRADPGTAGRVLQSVPDGARLTVIGEDREVDGRAWRNVRGDGGTAGWLAAEVVRSLNAPPTPTVTATLGSTATSTPAVEGTPIPRTPSPNAASDEPTPTPTPEPEKVEVYGTGSTGANLRARAGRSGSVLRSVPDGAQLTIVGEDEDLDGITWRHVQMEDGTTGWLAAETIRTVVQPTPTLRPGAPGIGAPMQTPVVVDQRTDAERAAEPCRPGQIKGDATAGVYYFPDRPEYAGLRDRVRCFDNEAGARASGYRLPDPPASPEAAPSPAPL